MASLCLFALASCLCMSCAPRMDQRQARYDVNQCPLCVVSPGNCSYCEGSGKCIYCHGTGTRTVAVPPIPQKGIEPTEFNEQCPYCKGSGECSYCNGESTCWVCKGSGTVDDWDFYHRHNMVAEAPDEADTLKGTN